MMNHVDAGVPQFIYISWLHGFGTSDDICAPRTSETITFVMYNTPDLLAPIGVTVKAFWADLIRGVIPERTPTVNEVKPERSDTGLEKMYDFIWSEREYFRTPWRSKRDDKRSAEP